MNTLELFSGTESFSKIMRKHNHNTLTIDNNSELKPDLCVSMLAWDGHTDSPIDFLWASPPCTSFSVASIGKHWTGGKKKYIPKDEGARLGLNLLDRTIELISLIKPT